MAKISSRKAVEEKRKELILSKKTARTQQSESSQNAPSVSIKSRYQRQKYHINNNEMARVLKQEIEEEMNLLQKKMQNIKQWMVNHKQASADELLLLYDMRRDLKMYNTKFQQSTQNLYSGDHQQIIEAIHDVSMNDIDCFENQEISQN